VKSWRERHLWRYIDFWREHFGGKVIVIIWEQEHEAEWSAVHITFDDLVIGIASNKISESNMMVQKLQS
jgi:hypothetical protein